MKKLITFLSGLLLLLIMFAALCLSGAIYDAGQKMTIDTYFFQPNAYYAHRVGVPDTPDSIGSDAMRNMLIERFITEYFYVIPDVNNIAQRTDPKTSVLRIMARSNVYQEWITKVVPVLKQMAEEKKLRTVAVTNVSAAPDQKNYWIVEYEFVTWEKPNDFSVPPIITNGQLYIQLIYEDGLREMLRKKPVEVALESGIDPAAVFKIRVDAVSSYEEIGQEK
jgi:hypothetical protein